MAPFAMHDAVGNFAIVEVGHKCGILRFNATAKIALHAMAGMRLSPFRVDRIGYCVTGSSGICSRLPHAV
jgi:hypothetical protein